MVFLCNEIVKQRQINEIYKLKVMVYETIVEQNHMGFLDTFHNWDEIVIYKLSENDHGIVTIFVVVEQIGLA